jgi:hypothetical protein
MRYTVIGLLQAAGVAAIVAYAAGADDYYAPDDVSRWEHATRDGGELVLGGVIAFAAAISIAFIGQRFWARSRLSGLFAVPAVALYCAALVFAYAVLSLGH